MGRGNNGSARAQSAGSRRPTKHELAAQRTAEALKTIGVPIDAHAIEDRETAVQDFMTDLMHLATERGWDWDELEVRARRHFDVEMDLHSRGEPHDGAAW